MVVATAAAAVVLIMAASFLAPDGWLRQNSAELSSEEIASLLPNTLEATVLDVTQSGDQWGTAFTLETPHPLHDGLTVLVRAWIRSPHVLSLQPNQRIELVRDDPGEPSYTLAGNPELMLRWMSYEGATRGDGRDAIELCTRVEMRGDCLAPFLQLSLATDSESVLPTYWSGSAVSAKDKSGLVFAAATITGTSTRIGEGMRAYSLQAVTASPDLIREALSDLSLTKTGAWASSPAAPFASAVPPGGSATGLPDTITATVANVTQSSDQWGTTFTLEMPYPLRDDLTAVLQVWLRDTTVLPLKPNQEIEFAAEGSQHPQNAYTALASGLELTVSWQVESWGDEATEACAPKDDQETAKSWGAEAGNGCATPILEALSFVDADSYLIYSGPSMIEPANEPNAFGLVTASAASYFGGSAFSVQALTRNPDSAREAFSNLGLTPDGTWDSRPAAPFGDVDSPRGTITGLPDTITATVVDVSKSGVSWGGSFTLEAPHPLRSDLTLLTRFWLPESERLSLEPNQRVEFIKEGVGDPMFDDYDFDYSDFEIDGQPRYTYAGDPEIVFRWATIWNPFAEEGQPDDLCGLEVGDGPARTLEADARDGCVSLIPASLTLSGAESPLSFGEADGSFKGPGATELVASTWAFFVYDGSDPDGFALQVATRNPGATRQALADLAIDSKGHWTSAPTGLFADVSSPAYDYPSGEFYYPDDDGNSDGYPFLPGD